MDLTTLAVTSCDGQPPGLLTRHDAEGAFDSSKAEIVHREVEPRRLDGVVALIYIAVN